MRRVGLIVGVIALGLAGVAVVSRDEPTTPRPAAVEPPPAAPVRLTPEPPQAVPAPLPSLPEDAGVHESERPDAAVAAPEPSLTTLAAELVDAGEAQPTTPELDAGRRPKVRDARFGVRWGEPGLCGEEPRAALAQRRAALLGTFFAVQRAQTTIFADPAVSMAVVDDVGRSLATARTILLRLLGARADVPFPVIYVYETAEHLRGVACVNAATAGYYDGAIHLPASDPDAARTVIHELTHHVLNTLGVHTPMWFHEGLAMYAADERWWEDPRSGLVAWLRREHLPFDAMVDAFPHTADELFAGAAYYQSYQMVRFVGARAGRPDFGWLVEALALGRLDAQTAFADGLSLAPPALERQWQAFVLSE